MDLLMSRWRRHYGRQSKQWPNTALFRSLNMAVAASKIPATVDVTLFDLGRTVGLWVSAFEILAHPGVGKSGLMRVYDLLEKAPWHDKGLKKCGYLAYNLSKPPVRRPMPSWLYGEIYRARNDFVHGNPIRRNRLHVKRSGRSLFQYSPMLYRMALAAFLPIDTNLEAADPADSEAYAKYVHEYFELFGQQREIEKGIKTVRHKRAGRGAP